MGSETRKKIQAAIRELGRADKYEIFTGKVVKVDQEEATVDVDINDNLIVFDVRLRAVIDDKTGLILWPELNSYISFAEMDGGPDHCIVKASKLSKLTLEIGKSTLEITDGNIVFNGGNNKGIPISEKVIDRLNKIESDLTKLKNSINNAPVAVGDGGTSFKASLISTYCSQSIAQSEISDIENTKLKH